MEFFTDELLRDIQKDINDVNEKRTEIMDFMEKYFNDEIGCFIHFYKMIDLKNGFNVLDSVSVEILPLSILEVLGSINMYNNAKFLYIMGCLEQDVHETDVYEIYDKLVCSGTNNYNIFIHYLRGIISDYLNTKFTDRFKKVIKNIYDDLGTQNNITHYELVKIIYKKYKMLEAQDKITYNKKLFEEETNIEDYLIKIKTEKLKNL